MGKLLQLATHCINDAQFYASQSKPRIRLDNNHVSDCLTFSLVRWVNDDNPFNGSYSKRNKAEAEAEVSKKYQPAINVISPGRHLQLAIEFEDEPPVYITYRHLIDRASTFTGTHNKKEKYLGLFKRTISHDYECTIEWYRHQFVIKCGSITEEITFEEYTAFIEKFMENLTRLQNEADEAKIDKRLNKYR